MNSKILLALVLTLGVQTFIQGYARRPLPKSYRAKENPVNRIFIDRWSPRAMSAEPMSDDALMELFEAARWAPSSFNEQPWRFIFAKRESDSWETFFDLLDPFNQEWCKNGAALVIILSNKVSSRGGENPTHSFDAGAAWQNFALQGSMKHLVVHAMSGFDHEKARKTLKIPDDYAIEAMCVVGYPGSITMLPEHLQEREYASERLPIESIVCEDWFTFDDEENIFEY